MAQRLVLEDDGLEDWLGLNPETKVIVLEDVIEVEEGHEHHIVESVEVSFEPQPLLWTQMESIIPPVEVQPVRSILGERLLNKNEELHAEVLVLHEVWSELFASIDGDTKERSGSGSKYAQLRGLPVRTTQARMADVESRVRQMVSHLSIQGRMALINLSSTNRSFVEGTDCQRPTTARTSSGGEGPVLSVRKTQDLSSLPESMAEALSVIDSLRQSLQDEYKMLSSIADGLREAIEELYDYTSKKGPAPTMGELLTIESDAARILEAESRSSQQQRPPSRAASRLRSAVHSARS